MSEMGWYTMHSLSATCALYIYSFISSEVVVFQIVILCVVLKVGINMLHAVPGSK
jgi:hypothetical protein